MKRTVVTSSLILSVCLGVAGVGFGQATTAPATPPATKPTAPQDPALPAPKLEKDGVTPSAGFIKRHEGFLADAKKGPFDVVFIGDSITDGWRNSGQHIFKECYLPLRTLNLGISGDRTEHVLWRIENGELDGLKPKVVVIMIGTNNSGNTAENIARGTTAVVKKVREKLPESKVLLLGIFPRGEKADPAANPTRAKLAKVNETLAKLDDGANVKYLDIGSAFLTSDGTITKDVMGDALHPSAKGYYLWAKAMNPVLAQMLGTKIAEPTMPQAAASQANGEEKGKRDEAKLKQELKQEEKKADAAEKKAKAAEHKADAAEHKAQAAEHKAEAAKKAEKKAEAKAAEASKEK